MSKLNNLLKLGLLIIYTVVIFGLAFFIVSKSNTSEKRFNDYSTVPYNDDIAVNMQIIEQRESSVETKTNYEYRKFDVYFVVTKFKNDKVSNIYSYLCTESNKKYSYTETSSPKTMGAGSYSTTTMSHLNSTNEFAYVKVVTDNDGNIVSVDNRKPESMYVKVVYDIEKLISNPGEEDKWGPMNRKELNFKFNFTDVNFKDFSSYETREVGSTYIDIKDDLFRIKLYKVANSTKENIDDYKVGILEEYRTNLDKLENGTNLKIDNIDLSIYGLITNKTMICSQNEKKISDKDFNEYVKLFNYEGSLNRGIRAIRTASINKNYLIEKLYVTAKCTTSDGKTYTSKFAVNVSDLKTN